MHGRCGMALPRWNGGSDNLLDPGNATEALRLRLSAMHVDMGVMFTEPASRPERLAFLLFGDRDPLAKDEKVAITYLSERAFRRFERFRPAAAAHQLKNRLIARTGSDQVDGGGQDLP